MLNLYEPPQERQFGMRLTVFISTLQLVLWICMSSVIVTRVQALHCEPLKPTNIECKNLTDLEPNLRDYCEGTAYDHSFWASSRNPMASAWPREYNKEIEYFQNIFSNMTKLVAEKRIDRNYRSYCPSPGGVLEDGSFSKYWHYEQRRWTYLARHYQERIGLELSKSYCFTEIHFDNSESTTIMQHLGRLNDGIEKAVAKLLKSARSNGSNFFHHQIGCWKHVTSPMADRASTPALSCTVMHTLGFRRSRNGSFYIPISLTNAPISESRKAKERFFLTETWNYDKKRDILRALPIPSYVRGNITQLRNDTTTALSTYGGDVDMSYSIWIPTEQVPAMRHLHEAGKNLQDSLQDEVSASNIATLVFPCLLAMVPISSFDLPSLNGSFKKIIAYSAVTDIVAALPLLIRGIEMLYLSTKTHTACTAWSVGIESYGLATIELWCAGCIDHRFFETHGIVFIVASVVFMILGVLGEILVLRFCPKNPSKNEKIFEKWWDRAGIAPDFCLEYDCCRLYSDIASKSEHFSSFDSYLLPHFTHRPNLDGKSVDTDDNLMLALLKRAE